MMSQNKQCLLVILALTCVGCGDEASPGRATTSDNVKRSNGTADTKLLLLSRKLGNQRRFTANMVAEIEFLHGEYPHHAGTTRLLEKAYVTRQEWNALVGLLKEKSKHERSAQDQLDLAKILTKAKRFNEAADVADSLLRENPADIEAAWIAAFTAFHSVLQNVRLRYSIGVLLR